MDFIFAGADKFDSTTLMQGDLLRRTDDLRDVLGEAHAYYAEAADYNHFMVLTQSCDLVRRDRRAKPKARYITIAAVRPLELVVSRRTEKAKYPDIHDELNVCQLDEQVIVEQFVERLINNTEDGFFCLPLGCHDHLTDDLCVFLHLSVALRADHYEACLGAKVGQLEEIFAAKLGWLTGNMYSRVATPDLHDKFGADSVVMKAEFTERVLNQSTLWLSPAQLKELKRLIRNEGGAGSISTDRLRELINMLPDDFSFVVDRAVELAKNNGFIEKEKAPEFRNVLLSDQNLKKRVLRTIK